MYGNIKRHRFPIFLSGYIFVFISLSDDSCVYVLRIYNLCMAIILCFILERKLNSVLKALIFTVL